MLKLLAHNFWDPFSSSASSLSLLGSDIHSVFVQFLSAKSLPSVLHLPSNDSRLWENLSHPRKSMRPWNALSDGLPETSERTDNLGTYRAPWTGRDVPKRMKLRLLHRILCRTLLRSFPIIFRNSSCFDGELFAAPDVGALDPLNVVDLVVPDATSSTFGTGREPCEFQTFGTQRWLPSRLPPRWNTLLEVFGWLSQGRCGSFDSFFRTGGALPTRSCVESFHEFWLARDEDIRTTVCGVVSTSNLHDDILVVGVLLPLFCSSVDGGGTIGICSPVYHAYPCAFF